MMKSDSNRVTDFLGLWPESLWWEPRPGNKVHPWLGEETRDCHRDILLRVQHFWKSPESIKRYLKNADRSKWSS